MEHQEEKKEWDLDEVLTDLKFGRFQIQNFFLIGLLLLFSNYQLVYVFTTADLHYRCAVPECDPSDLTKAQFMAPWIHNAVPFRGSEPWKCKRYEISKNSSYKSNSNTSNTCSTSFNSFKEIECKSWVFETKEVNIVNDFSILCENRKWELTTIGSLEYAAQLIGTPIFGVLSDVYGRKFITIMCTIMGSVCGICQAFSVNQLMFMGFDLMGAFFITSIYSTAFTLAIELVSPKMRCRAATITSVFYPVGAVVVGFVAWYFQNWRHYLIALYSPGFLFIFYIWLIPESVRWLQTNGRHKEAVQILRKMAACNNIEQREKIDSLKVYRSSNKEEQSFVRSVTSALKTKVVVFRLMICSFLWFANTLIYYGLDVNSVEMAGNKYLNFILTNGIEIPACLTFGFVMNYVERRPSQSTAFILSGLACVACEFVPSEMQELSLVLYLISKFLITGSFCITYVYTIEIFPTDCRQLLCGLVSTVGRFGAIIAPQTTLLGQMLGKSFPVLFFGTISIIAGVLTNLLPETFNMKLPDTIEQTR